MLTCTMASYMASWFIGSVLLDYNYVYSSKGGVTTSSINQTQNSDGAVLISAQ